MSSSRVISVVLDADPGKRLDKAIHARLPSDLEMSRSRLTELIKAGALEVNGGDIIINPAARPMVEGVYKITIPAAVPMTLLAENIPLDILHEDDDLVVVNKPAGMVVHPAPGAERGTLVAALLHHCGDRLTGIGDVLRPGIVHRIDKDTSGLLVVAKSDVAHRGLSAQFADHSISRRYKAFVWGVPSAASPRLMGLDAVTAGSQGIKIEAAIARSPRDRKKMAVVQSGGKRAVTHIQIEEQLGAAAQVSCQLETGRTHQIRVHLSHAGHPLIGDPVYGRQRRFAESAENADAIRVVEDFNRQALHAVHLGFVHPVSEKEMTFSTEPPADMQTLLAALRTISSK